MNWNLEYLFKTREDFLKSLEELKTICEKIKDYKGKLSDRKSFKEYYLLQLEIEEKLGKTYQYASLKSDLDKRNIEGLSDLDLCRSLLYKMNEYMSFENPELLAIGEDKVMSYIDSDLEQFRFGFEKLFRMKKYILDDKCEKLLSIYSPVLSAGRNLYSSLAVSDANFKEVELENGEKVKVTNGNYSSLIADAKKSETREKIFDALYENYDAHKTTYGQIYKTVMDGCKAQKDSKGYESILESFLFANNIPVSVYHNLVKVAGTENEPLKKYIELRKKYLGLDVYHTYDRFLELASSTSKYTYKEAKELFFKSIERFPEEFQNKAKTALEEGFVDVNEKDGKRSGAYSSSQTNLHPYILLNYTNTLDDVFTVAHEAGHSMHSLYAMENNPMMLQHYTIFVAEIASTFNEHNLLDYMMKSGKLSDDDKIVLLQKAIDNIIGTFYRQTLFAEYELTVSKMVEEGKPINHEVLSETMITLYKKYYGLDISKEKYKKYVWAYIPHLFYTPFYVYQYATSFAASFKIYQDINDNVEGAFDKYLGLLKAGGSKYPVEEAMDAGVDFTKIETFEAVTKRMKYLVDELEKVLNK